MVWRANSVALNGDRERHGTVRLVRRALTIIEMSLAFALLAVVVVAAVRMQRVVGDHRRAAERRDIALQAAQAVSEQVGNVPWNQLSAASVDQITIPGPLAARLPGANLAIALNDEVNPPAKRILVKISWNGRGEKPTSVQLTSWAFPE
jgi:hypothetical protein